MVPRANGRRLGHARGRIWTLWAELGFLEMKITLASNFWYLRGGLERVMFAEASGLRERGHEVRPFASAHPLNEPASTSSYFPPSVDHGALGREQGPIDRALTAARLVHHGRAVRAFK